MYLASRSPQRKALLEALGLSYDVVEPRYAEVDPPGAKPAGLVEAHSRGKAFSVLDSLVPLSREKPVLGVDTIVAVAGRALGKARDADEAREFISLLSGRRHEVYSGITLLAAAGAGEPDPREDTRHAVTTVEFAKLSPAELDYYIATGEWRERAGAYAIQGRASAFVLGVEGDYTNVVGLPVPLLVAMLSEVGLWPPQFPFS